MADTRLKPDPNGRNVIGAIDDSTGDIVPLYVANATGRLKVDASVTLSGLATAVTDGEAVDAADVGNLALGTDGSNYQVLHTDSTGDLQVDLASALPAGTNAIGKLSANSGVDIGDVDVTSLNDGGNSITVDNTVLSVVGGGLEATAQRVTLASDSTGVLSIDDNGGALTVDGTVSLGAGVASIGILGANSGVDIGDVTINNASGGSAVNIQDGGNAITVDNGGTFVVQENGAALTALQLIDDGVYTDDTSTHSTGTSKGYGIMAAATPTDGSVNANDIGMVAMTTDRKLHVSVQDAIPAGTNAIGKLAANSGVDIGDVDITSVIPGTGATNLGKREDDPHTSLDTGVFVLGVANEANTTRAADSDYTPLATDTEGNVRVVGNRDHDAIDAGEVVSVGGVAIAHGTNPTAVAAADRTKWYFNRAGIPFVIGGHPNILTKQLNVTDVDGAQTDTDLLGAIASGTKYIVTLLQVMADGANSGDVGFRIGFGTVNTPANDAAAIVASHPGLKAGSGVIIGNGGGIVGAGADGAELRLTCEDPVGGALDIVVHYYTIES